MVILVVSVWISLFVYLMWYISPDELLKELE